nr:immunoglobulin light chain junction region [Macaca mulatta]
CMQGLDFQWMF